MPKTSISSPGATGAVDRLTLLTADVRDEGVAGAGIFACSSTICMAEE
jgi:hypothetical protein